LTDKKLGNKYFDEYFDIFHFVYYCGGTVVEGLLIVGSVKYGNVRVKLPKRRVHLTLQHLPTYLTVQNWWWKASNHKGKLVKETLSFSTYRRGGRPQVNSSGQHAAGWSDLRSDR